MLVIKSATLDKIPKKAPLEDETEEAYIYFNEMNKKYLEGKLSESLKDHPSVDVPNRFSSWDFPEMFGFAISMVGFYDKNDPVGKHLVELATETIEIAQKLRHLTIEW